MERAGIIPVKELRSEIKRLRLSQAQIAASIGRNQGQVSRLLSAQTTPHSKTYEQICSFVQAANPECDGAARQLVLDAVKRCWDGSMEHAISLAQILDALAAYRRAAKPRS